MVLLIDVDGKKIGEVEYSEAKRISKERGLDLLLVNQDRQIFKLGDVGKLKYDKKRRKKQQLSQKRMSKIKEIRLCPTTDTGDIQIKLRRASEFLRSGLRTKIVMRFKRSQMSYRTAGMEKMQNIVNILLDDGICTLTSPLKFEGNRIIAFLAPIK